MIDLLPLWTCTINGGDLLPIILSQFAFARPLMRAVKSNTEFILRMPLRI